MSIQAVIFPKNYTLNNIIDFLYKHNLKPKKSIDTKQKNWLRVRITSPKLYSKYSTKILNNNVRLIIGYN
jgi:hypothetical protein